MDGSQAQMVTAVCWVRRGVAKEMPDQYKVDLSEQADGGDEDMHVDEEESENEEVDDTPMNPNNPNDKYDMEHYDEEEKETSTFLGGSLTSLMMYKKPSDDPYLVVPAADTLEDTDDYLIRKTDNLLLAAVSEEDMSHLDVHVYEHEKDNLYVHHDYLLPAFPLAVTWLSFPVGGEEISGKKTTGNIAAIATFEPYIELWDLDTVDQPAPLALLGGPENPDDLVNGSVKNSKLVADSHTDSVLGLSWNVHQKNVLASCSADKSVKLWDLMTGSCIRTYKNHKDKVQSVLWNPVESPILATGGFDHNAFIIDIRAPPESPSSCLFKNFPSDVECLTWLPAPLHSQILISCENGYVYCFDILKGFSEPLWTLQAHTKSTQAVAANPFIPGLIATGSSDHASPLKFWDVSDGRPKVVYSRTGDINSVFSISWNPDEPFVIALGTNETKPVVLDCVQIPEVMHRYGNYKKPEQPSNNTGIPQFHYTPPASTSSTSTSSSSSSTSSAKKSTGKNKKKK